MRKQVYEARIGAPFQDGEAQEIGEFVEQCRDKSTEGILERIKKNKSHVIAKYIEWDDKKASFAYRLQQVRNIVNHIEVKIITVGDSVPRQLSVPIRAFHSVSISEQPNSYISVVECFGNDNYRQQIISRAKNELQNWTERYEMYSELSTIVETIRLYLRPQEQPKSSKLHGIAESIMLQPKPSSA